VQGPESLQGEGRLRHGLTPSRAPGTSPGPGGPPVSPPGRRWRVPDLGVGVGLRIPHYEHLAATWPEVAWFEVISENFFVDGGSPRYWLDRFRERYPVVLHGVAMSLGSEEDPEHTRRLVELARRVRAPWVSDHLCFTRAGGVQTHDLLPLPYTEEVLRHVIERCKRIAGSLSVPFAVENPSTYLGWRASEMSEVEFLVRLAEAADIGLLLDVNNVFVSACNHGFDPLAYLDAVPAERVVQIHLAGHSVREGYRLDTHDGPVCDEVTALYRRAVARLGPVSTLIEWDDRLPPFPALQAEAARAAAVRAEALGG
jgi:uncharacterized protein (UPF0276 family)